MEDNLNACGAVQNGNTSQFDGGKLSAQLNFNCRLAQTQNRKNATPFEKIARRPKKIAKTDKLVLYLLASGLSGGKDRFCKTKTTVVSQRPIAIQDDCFFMTGILVQQFMTFKITCKQQQKTSAKAT